MGDVMMWKLTTRNEIENTARHKNLHGGDLTFFFFLDSDAGAASELDSVIVKWEIANFKSL